MRLIGCHCKSAVKHILPPVEPDHGRPMRRKPCRTLPPQLAAVAWHDTSIAFGGVERLRAVPRCTARDLLPDVAALLERHSAGLVEIDVMGEYVVIGIVSVRFGDAEADARRIPALGHATARTVLPDGAKLEGDSRHVQPEVLRPTRHQLTLPKVSLKSTLARSHPAAVQIGSVRYPTSFRAMRKVKSTLP